MVRTRFGVLIVAAVVASLQQVGLAGFTHFELPPNVKGPVLSPAEVLSQMYGGQFEAVGDTYTNGKMTLAPLPEVETKTLRPIEGFGTFGDPIYNTDQPPTGLTIFEPAEGVRFMAGGGNSPYLLSYLPDGRFEIQGIDQWFSSDPADNADGRNHLKVYSWLNGPLVEGKVPGTGGARDGYVLFWEDGDGTDFTDFVVGSKLAEAAAVPLPPAALASLGALGLVAADHLRRRRRATR